ncbi:MAG: hypothetical protein QHC90_25835 [Shinella sp.]|nr:hypothetical protein [Shinella sp.]
MEYAIGIAVALVIGLGVYFSLARLLGRKLASVEGLSTVEQRFRNVYAIMDESRRQSIIRYYMEKYECSREEAMRRAVEERERDTSRW